MLGIKCWSICGNTNLFECEFHVSPIRPAVEKTCSDDSEVAGIAEHLIKSINTDSQIDRPTSNPEGQKTFQFLDQSI